MKSSQRLVCALCDQVIAHGDALWYTPFAAAPSEGRLADTLTNRITGCDNGGTPFHRDCLNRLVPGLGSILRG